MAAGQGFKTFTTGEVLTAGDVNGYLMQGINVFTNATARDAAITAPAEGQFAFTKDNNSLWYYDGAAWVASGATGDIEGVTAGVGISGGGTSGTVTVTNSMATAITTAGDLIKGTGSGTFDRLGIGSTGQVLTVSAGAPAWATPATAASGLTFISRTNLSASSSPLSLNSIFTSTYENYRVYVSITQSSTSTGVNVNLRSSGSDDTSGNYYFSRYGRNWVGSGSAVSQSSQGVTTFQNFLYNENNKRGAGYFDIINPQVADVTSLIGAAAIFAEAYDYIGQLQTTTQYDGLSLSWSGTLTAVVTVYGWAKS
jgi:hypothetical protein